MSVGPTSTGLKLHDEIRRGAAYTARLAPSRAGVAALTSASARLLNPSGDEVWTGPATVVASAGSVVIPGSATTDVDPATGWLIEWTYTLTDATEDTALSPCDIVLYTVKPVAVWKDLTDRHADLGRLLDQDLETAQAKGDQAWLHITQALRSKSRRPCLIVDSAMLYELHILYWLALIYSDLDTGGAESSEGQRGTRYHAQFEALWLATTFEVADPVTWRRTGDRKSTRGSLYLGGTGAGSWRPVSPLPTH